MSHSTESAETVNNSDLESDNGTPAKTFEEQVNAATAGMTQKEDGTWEVPDGLPEEVRYAANLEKRRRDTQSALAKTSHENKALLAERDNLRTLAVKNAVANLTTEQKEELEDLKQDDPDAWLEKKQEYEQSALAAVEEELDAVGEKSGEIIEIERRAGVLTTFLDNNPGLVLNDEVFQNDLPPRITSKLANGEATFEEFLEEAKKFLQPGVRIKGTGDTDEDEPNLGSAGGGSTASQAAVNTDADSSYEKEIY